ncbi:MAG TPA: CvpA family protein [Rhizomicrobium sp.]|jgi:membrane protein required for colicin V production
MGFTVLDLLVVVVILLSVIYAISRGFVEESLSILAWAVAAFATLFFAPRVAPLLRDHFTHVWESAAVAYLGVFLVVLIPLQFMSHRFAETVRRSEIGPIDRSLGAVFGLLRGLAIVGIAYLLFTVFVPIRDQPHWVLDARLLPMIQKSSDVIASIVPDQRGVAGPERSEFRAEAREGPVPRPRPGRALRHSRKSYSARDRERLNSLIQSTGSGN